MGRENNTRIFPPFTLERFREEDDDKDAAWWELVQIKNPSQVPAVPEAKWEKRKEVAVGGGGRYYYRIRSREVNLVWSSQFCFFAGNCDSYNWAIKV